MVKSFPRSVVEIRNFDGSCEPFDAMALQTRLIGSFLAAGRGDSSFMAEDIALAVEYTLSHVERPEPVFGRGELDAAVIRLLEVACLPDVAKIFRKGLAETSLLVSAYPATLSDLLRNHLACPAGRFERVLTKILDAARKLNITEASPHLWLELARHYEREMAEEEPIYQEMPLERTLTRDEITAFLPPEALALYKAGALRINGVTTLFPCIHLYFMMNEFAKIAKLEPPVIELLLEPQLYNISGVLESARALIAKNLDSSRPLPCILTIPDMLDFISEYLDSDSAGSEKIAADLAAALAGQLNCDLFKLSFS